MKYISIYRVLLFTNVAVFIVMCLCYWINGASRFVNDQTIVLNAVLIIINHIMLLDAKRNNNTLLFVLCFVMILHYAFRIVTLNFFDFSLPFMRGGIDVGFINENYLYIIISVCIMWAMLHYKNKKVDVEKSITSHTVTKNILILLIVSYILSVLTSLGVPIIGKIVSICSTFFFNMQYMILLGTCYFLYYKESISRRHQLVFTISLIAYVLIYTLLGSRGTMYNLGMAFLIALLSTNIIYIKKKYIIVVIFLVPFAILTFLVGSLMRFSGKAGLSGDDIQAAFSMRSEVMDANSSKDLIAPAFDRIGFFDYSVNTIHNKEKLSQYIKPINYYKSVVDNLLTPGFNIYDMPRMSFIPPKVDSFGAIPSYKDIDLTDEYSSAQFSIFGESYLLFGRYGSYLFYFILCLLYRHLFIKSKDDYSIFGRWRIVILLYTFYVAQRSYGFDWWFIEVFGLIINYYIFSYIVKKSSLVKARRAVH